MAEIIKINSHNQGQVVKKVAKLIREGKVLIYPTETSYGIGCDATNINAIKKIRKIKGRNSKPMLIIVSSLAMIKRYAYINNKTEYLVKKFMPGPLTIVVKKKPSIPNELSKEGIAFRISSNAIASELTKYSGVPIVSTSANMSGKQPNYNVKNIIRFFKNKVVVIIDCGNLEKNKPSTIIDMTTKIKIIRRGPILKKDILEELN